MTPETPEREVDCILNDCFLAVGGAVGDRKLLTYDAISWWRDRYRGRFSKAITLLRNSWIDDRDRLLGVSRFLGERAVSHAGENPSIDCDSAMKASDEIEAGCQMRRGSLSETDQPLQP